MTCEGGGAVVIPFLNVYAVLPASVVFTVCYAYAAHHLSRDRLFNFVIGSFAAMLFGFAFCLYPHHDTLHLHRLAEHLAAVSSLSWLASCDVALSDTAERTGGRHWDDPELDVHSVLLHFRVVGRRRSESAVLGIRKRDHARGQRTGPLSPLRHRCESGADVGRRSAEALLVARVRRIVQGADDPDARLHGRCRRAAPVDRLRCAFQERCRNSGACERHAAR